MSDEEAKAKQEIAKATGKAIDLADKAGGFFDRVFGQPVEDTIGRYWGDKIAADRKIRAIDLAIKVQNKLKAHGISEVYPIPAKIGVPLIEFSSLEDEPILREMWENLLFNAIKSDEADVEKSYVKTLDLFSASNAILLNYLYPRRIKATRNSEQRTSKEFPARKSTQSAFSAYKVCKEAGVAEHDIRSLIRFGIIDSTYSEVKLGIVEDTHYGIEEKKIHISNGLEEFVFTDFGLSFSKAVIEE